MTQKISTKRKGNTFVVVFQVIVLDAGFAERKERRYWGS